MQKNHDDFEWSGLTRQQRVALCREQAKEAEDLSQISQPGLRESYQALAKQWRLLAAEIERSITAISS
jgi:hypothetical protein